MSKTQQGERFTITCSECGRQDTVPFRPVDERPVYCRSCFAKRKDAPITDSKFWSYHKRAS